MEDPAEFDVMDYPDVARVREAFPHCAVMPLSRLTINETGVNNGDIDSFSTSLFVRNQNGLMFSCASGGWGERGEQIKQHRRDTCALSYVPASRRFWGRE